MRSYVCAFNGDVTSTTTTEYTTVQTRHNSNWTTTEAGRQMLVADTGVFHSLHILTDQGPGGGGSYDFTLRINGAASSLTVNHIGTGSADFTNRASVSPGDLVTIECSPNSPANALFALISMIYESTTDFNRSLWIGGHPNLTNRTLTEFNYIAGGAQWATQNIGSVNFLQIPKVSGDVSDFYVDLSTAPGSGNSYTFGWLINGALVAGVSISGTATTGSNTGSSGAVSDGNSTTLRCVPSSSPTATRARWGCAFDTSEAYEFCLMGGSKDTLNTSSTEYNSAPATNLTWTGTETLRRITFPRCCTISNFRVQVGTNPGLGDSWTFTVMKNGVATSLAVTISDFSLSATDSTNFIEFARNDAISIRCTPSGTPAATDCAWGMSVRQATIEQYMMMAA